MLDLAMQMVECSLEYVRPRTRAAQVSRYGAMIAGQCRQLVDFVRRTAGHVEPFQAWCIAQNARLQRY